MALIHSTDNEAIVGMKHRRQGFLEVCFWRYSGNFPAYQIKFGHSLVNSKQFYLIIGKEAHSTSRPNFYHTMSMYSTCDPKSNETEREGLMDDNLLSPTQSFKSQKLSRPSNGK